MHCKDILFLLAGLSLVSTYDDLSFNKDASQSYTYSNLFTGASNAIDRNISTCMKQLDIGLNSLHKTVWWKVDLGGVYNIYSINILFKTYDGYGCNKSGVYGINCNISCSINCQDNSCNIENGRCFGCKPGWSDTFCDKECREGWYGMNCSQPCGGHCRDGATCNHVTGQCDRGCDAGWSGLMCSQECYYGTFGYDCVDNCSGHCLNNSPCNKETGHCDRGCDPGYTGVDCSKECSPEQFGLNCRERCSGHCINNEPCDHVTGSCTSGCLDGFIGTHCNYSCKEGYVDTNCSRECKPGTFCHTDGSCTFCTASSTADNCTTNCLSQKYESLCSSIWIVGFSLSLGLNGIFIFGTIVLCRGIVKRKVQISGNLLSFWKESLYYTDADPKFDETSTYQELSVSAFSTEPSYQNTIIR